VDWGRFQLLILVRPEFAAALDPHEVPPGGPGLDTTSPTDSELYLRGYIEVPRCDVGGGFEEYQDGGAGAADGDETVEPLAPPAPAAAAADPALPSSRRLLSQTQAWHKPKSPSRNGTAATDSYNRSHGSKRSVTDSDDGGPDSLGLIGPLGYDVE